MRKIVLITFMLCLLTPMNGWAKKHIYWYSLTPCSPVVKTGCRESPFPPPTCFSPCRMELHVDSEKGNLGITLQRRSNTPPHEISEFSTRTYFQEEPSATYDVTRWGDLDHETFLEVIIVTDEQSTTPRISIIPIQVPCYEMWRSEYNCEGDTTYVPIETLSIQRK